MSEAETVVKEDERVDVSVDLVPSDEGKTISVVIHGSKVLTVDLVIRVLTQTIHKIVEQYTPKPEAADQQPADKQPTEAPAAV